MFQYEITPEGVKLKNDTGSMLLSTEEFEAFITAVRAEDLKILQRQTNANSELLTVIIAGVCWVLGYAVGWAT